MLRLSRYQWTVLFAAWLGWGFDVFDGLLFNYVAPNCVPTLLGLTIGTPEAKAATLFWTGLLTSILLLGWAAGGVIFGQLADRIGRSKTLLITMLLYALGTAFCAFAPNMWFLVFCRIIASLGIGGEWAAGASMVAEVVPEKSRVEAGALLYTSAPAGLFLATYVNFQIAGVLFSGNPETSWRYVFLCGLIPAAVAFIVRLFVKEPERWQKTSTASAPPRLGELFNRQNLPLTISGFLMALTALLTWWSCNAFIPVIATGLARTTATAQSLDKSATLALIENWKVVATSSFNLGGLIGTLLTIPAAKYLGRKKMFSIYFILSAASMMATFGLPLPPVVRLYMYFTIGISVFGVFGSFTYYLPELFPTRLRATGSGFCYNIGRVFAAIGPFLVGAIASRGANALDTALQVLFWVGFIPLLGLAFMPWVIETKGRVLAD
ncbi:MFS transporter [Plectonema radiosum NIES-515]|uniref:MFS transporter n=1 Tax=Plectonema radiosum NIES-515 TaxID=2986073 RepID=A0ABT3B4E1_9CYAN|nr:MFS transporter [Plectonema radiosum]MCV3216245.1 MFS transporter [Plectonema radiosum NIES-515]